MSEIVIEAAFFAAAPTQLEEVCWLAREILGGYMDEGSALLFGDEVADISDEEDTTDNIIIHETPPLMINKLQRASLSNLPYVKGHTGKLVPMPSTGYVALRVEPAERQAIDDQMDLDEDCQQIIFRQSNPAELEKAAIFRGFSLDESARIPDKRLGEIKRLDFVLRCLRTGYRRMMQEDTESFEGTYLSQVPFSNNALIEDLLGYDE